jgi:Leucine-rich repeat (LRR) protein
LLVLKDDDGSNPAPSIDKTILKEFKGVRVLDLSETGITQLPENIGKLKHVRYLGLPGTISSSYPCDEVNKLLLLQTLSVRGKKKKEEFISNIGGIGRLSKLQESIKFKVTRGSEKEGHGLWELAEMNSLGEKLTIKGLEAVASKKEAEEAQLGEKDSVKILKLKWEPPKFSAAAGSSAAAAADPAGAVLEGLQPHRYLNELRIARYPGELLHTPTWLSGLETMTRLYLKNCRKLKALPVLGGLQALELLVIKELTSVERIKGDFCGGGAFPKLKKIVLEDMRVLVAWDDMPGDAFPVLSDVSIVDCPELSSLAGLGCCGGSISLSVSRCRAITLKTLPAKFSDGVSTCKFH